MKRVLPFVVVIAVAACNGSGEPGPSVSPAGTVAPDTTGPAELDTTTTSVASTTTTIDYEVPTPTVLAAIEDLARRLDVETREIRLIEAGAVVWDDAGLGCPDPGTTYVTVVEPGARIVLNHGERAFDYHAGSDGNPFLCATGDPDGGYDFMPPPGFDT